MSQKKEKAKGFIKNNKKKVIAAGLLVIAGLVYVFCDYELDIDKVTNAICGFIGGC